MISLCNDWVFTQQWSDGFASGSGDGQSVRLPHTVRELPLHYADHEAYQTGCGYRKVLSLGEETAHSLGMDVKKIRTLLLILAAMLAGASVSFAGLLGFVGLIVPHAIRRLAGSESRILLPLCAIGGAGFVTACDLAARMLFIPYELPVGILMSVLGGPFFLGLLLKRKGGRSHA